MTPIKVNADYESVLFHNKEFQAANHAIEFLAFYLEDKPFFSTKKYHPDFLNHVESVCGNYPEIVSKGKFQNWWGELSNLPLEKKLNDKQTSAKLSSDSQLISSLNELALIPGRKYLAKDPFGMSGMGFVSFTEPDERLEKLLSKAKTIIVEPQYDRLKDFSHYVSGKETICYENLVDHNFQYKGTLYNDLNNPSIESLSFYPEYHWNDFQSELSRIVDFYRTEGAYSGFSIDSFTYSENGRKKIRALSEVNYRKTMGFLAYNISLKLAGHDSWTLMVLGKAQNKFHELIEKTSTIPGCTLLSPGDSRFEIFLIHAPNREEGKIRYDSLRKLLPDCQFTVEI